MINLKIFILKFYLIQIKSDKRLPKIILKKNFLLNKYPLYIIFILYKNK
jgi:hypothetical protein